MDICGIIMMGKYFPAVLCDDTCECERPSNHQGEHAVRAQNGRFWAFWTDLTCDCEQCQSNEPDDWCELYTEITPEEMQRLCASPELVLYDVYDA